MAIIRIQDFFKEKGQQENFVFVFKTQIKSQGQDSFSFSSATYVPLDCTVSENYQLQSSITDNEIESGSTVSDHIHLQPERVQIKAIMSESPVFFLPAVVRGLVDLGTKLSFDIISGATGFRSFSRRVSPVLAGFEKYAREFVSSSVSSAILGGTSRRGIQKAFWTHFLKARFYDKNLFSIRSGLDRIDNVFFESISFDRTQKIGDSISFDCTLKQVRVVKSNIIITGSPAGKNHRRKNLGDVGKIEVDTGEIIQSEGETVKQIYPNFPEGSITKIEDRVRIPLSKAKNVVDNAVNNARSSIQSFAGDIFNRVF